MLQILFLCIAYARGWKSKALIPIGAVIVLGLFLAATGAVTKPDDPIVVVLDVGATIVLAIMSVVAPSSARSISKVVEVKSETHPIDALARIN